MVLDSTERTCWTMMVISAASTSPCPAPAQASNHCAPAEKASSHASMLCAAVIMFKNTVYICTLHEKMSSQWNFRLPWAGPRKQHLLLGSSGTGERLKARHDSHEACYRVILKPST